MSGVRTASIAFAALLLGTAAGPAGSATERSGVATHYEPHGQGACGLPQPALHTAMNSADYDGSALCGAYVRATRPGHGTVTVQVTNECPDCAPGQLDLSPAAFDRLARRIEGRVPVRWHVVAAPVRGPVAFRFKDESTRWWTQVQVRNHRYPVRTLELRRGDGWLPLPRERYNYFTAADRPGPGPFTFRVTDGRGHRLVERGVRLSPGRVVSGRGQFPA